MSKMGQAVFEGQEFAQENYNVPKIEFVKMAEKLGPVVKDAAIEEYEIINSEMHDFFDHMSKYSGHPEFG